MCKIYNIVCFCSLTLPSDHISFYHTTPMIQSHALFAYNFTSKCPPFPFFQDVPILLGKCLNYFANSKYFSLKRDTLLV